MSEKKHGVRYPWKKWFKKGKTTLKRGTDYACTTFGMMRNALQAADREGKVIRTETKAEEGTECLVLIVKGEKEKTRKNAG